jgi:hypothetical protein
MSGEMGRPVLKAFGPPHKKFELFALKGADQTR